MDKDLALAFEFENAPAEVKARAKEHKDSWLRLEKAKAQSQVWAEEFAQARRDYFKTSKAFKEAVNAWDPAETKDPKPKEKAKKEDPVEAASEPQVTLSEAPPPLEAPQKPKLKKAKK